MRHTRMGLMSWVRAVTVTVAITSGGCALAASTAPIGVAQASPGAQIACVHARIGGQSKCIARGQYCARRYERQYERYGFTCSKRDRNGRYHLE